MGTAKNKVPQYAAVFTRVQQQYSILQRCEIASINGHLVDVPTSDGL